MMRVGILQFSMNIPWSKSLKDKRRVIRSLKDRLRQRFNISIAEIEDQNNHKVATLGITMAGNDPRYMNGALDKIVEMLGDHPEADLLDHQIEII